MLAHIGEYAEAGRTVDTGVAIDLRMMRISRRFRRYLIFYRAIDGARVEIVRVLHGAHDLNALIAKLGGAATVLRYAATRPACACHFV